MLSLNYQSDACHSAYRQNLSCACKPGCCRGRVPKNVRFVPGLNHASAMVAPRHCQKLHATSEGSYRQLQHYHCCLLPRTRFAPLRLIPRAPEYPAPEDGAATQATVPRLAPGRIIHQGRPPWPTSVKGLWRHWLTRRRKSCPVPKMHTYPISSKPRSVIATAA